MDIEVPRNGDYLRTWRLRDVDKVAIDLTGTTLEADARVVAGFGPVLASATITIEPGTSGLFSMRWHGADFDGVGSVTEVAAFAWDLKHRHADGIVEIVARGTINLIPGVTA